MGSYTSSRQGGGAYRCNNKVQWVQRTVVKAWSWLRLWFQHFSMTWNILFVLAVTVYSTTILLFVYKYYYTGCMCSDYNVVEANKCLHKPSVQQGVCILCLSVTLTPTCMTPHLMKWICVVGCVLLCCSTLVWLHVLQVSWTWSASNTDTYCTGKVRCQWCIYFEFTDQSLLLYYIIVCVGMCGSIGCCSSILSH